MEGVDLPFLTIRQAGELLRTRQLSPVELVEAVLGRIRRYRTVLNDYITVMDAEALHAARQAEREIAAGEYRGPLHGIPIGLKDLYATRGVRTTGGSQVLANNVPNADATVTRKLRRAGAVIIGKHNCHEFAAGATNENPYFGTAHNPWDLKRVPGGSSGGTAASVAAGTCMGGMGSDTGGSIRIPAAACGIVGLKPTYGRVSRYGVIPRSWTMDTTGPMTRTVWDCAAMLSAVAGYDPRDPSSLRTPVPDYTAELDGTSLHGVRVGLPREFFWDDLHEEVEPVVRRAIATLERLGAQVVEVSLPSIHLAYAVYAVVTFSESAAWHEEWLTTRPQDYGADVRQRFHVGQVFSAVQYHKAQRVARLVRQEVLDALAQADVLVTPTLPVAAPPIGEATVRVRGVPVPAMDVLARLTRPFNVSLTPTLSVPCGFTSDGLPVGLQISGRDLEEGLVLRVGHAYEQATQWHLRHPPL